MKIDTDTAAFLENLLFAHPENEDGENPMDGKSTYDFTPEFTAAVKGFCDGFREFLHNRNVEIPESDRSFGGNVYLSLSGHGCGFWDSNETKHLQLLLEKYSGDKHRFEEIDLAEGEETGKLDLAILPEFITAARLKMFTPANP